MPKIADGWRQVGENWYNVDVCRGLAAHVKANCDHCGQECFVRKFRNRDTGKKSFCSRSCKMRWQTGFQNLEHLKPFEFKKGQKAHNFKGRTFHTSGYVCIPQDGKVYLEHRLAVEKFIGRKLRRNEVIHHINGDVADNRIENLQIMKQLDHIKLHWTEGTFNNREAVKKERIIASWLKEQEMKKNIPKGDK